MQYMGKGVDAMSDFGTDLGNNSLSLTGKLTEALLKLIGKTFDIIQEQKGKMGFNHKNLEKASVPLTAVGITLNDKDFNELADRCKREGIVITGVEDIRERELSGNKSIIVECKQSDLQKIAGLVDLMNDEKKIDRINEEINTMKYKEAELIGEDNLIIQELEKQIKEIRYGHSEELNAEQAQGVCEQAVSGKNERGVTFDETLDRWTGGSIDKDTACYVVDAKDPNKYIVCNAKKDLFHNNEYIKTTYEVYDGSKQVYSGSDRRFEGRPKDYWAKEKAAMKETGGFRDLVFKFYSIHEVDAYRENYKMQNANKLDDLKVGNVGRNYDAIIKNLETKIDKCGATFRDGVVIDKETGKAITLSEGMSDMERAKVAEASVIGKQITNYKKISQLEIDIAIARTNVLTTKEGTAEHKIVQAEFEQVESKYKSALEMEASLVDERKSVNAVQAEQEVTVLPQAVKNAQKAEKSDDRRDDRVDEIDENHRTMAEYKGEIAENKKKDGAKGNDVKDREATKKEAIPKSKGDI